MADEIQNYNKVSRVFHWVIAALILGLLAVGFFMESMERSPLKFEIYGVHKALGILVLGFAIFRIIWTLLTQKPKALTMHKTWEKQLYKTIHIVLYIMIIAFPLSGWVMSSAGGYGVSFFGLFEVPPIVGKDPELGKLANQIHGIFGYVMLACVGLHVLGALKHHVIDKDATLRRMGGNLVFGVLGLILLAVAAYFPAQKFVSKFAVTDVVQNESGHESAQ